ncbi:MAG: hypothetical protein PVF56_18600 [Desulfobacterales bacterium]|jgi:hypothetical protein
MNDPGMVGIGCFAKPEKLSRVLRKMVEGYILGNLEGHIEKNVDESKSSDLILLLKTVIGGMTGNQQAIGSEIIDSLTGKKITGFFLAMEKEGLNLSVFIRESRLTSKKITTQLGVLTQIRKKRLH